MTRNAPLPNPFLLLPPLLRVGVHSLPAPSPTPDMLFVLAHEVRAPLCAILGLADLLRDPTVPLPAAEQRELLDDIVAAALRLDRLLDDCLEAITRGAAEIAIAPRPIVLADVIARARIESGAPERIQVALAAPLAVVAADPDRIVQVLLNLFANALRASPAESPVLLTVTPRESCLEVRVEDRGPGVEPALQPHLFEPFRRGSNSHRAGLGLGLSLCRRLIEGHGGTLDYDPSGDGAAFVFTLPWACDAAQPSD